MPRDQLVNWRGLTSPHNAVGTKRHGLREVRNVVKKDFYFEDLDLFTQEIIIDLVVSIIKNEQNQVLKQEEHYEESSDLC